MNENWIGRAISIKCIDDLGIFQGYIKDANSSKIVIHKAFRNGLPLKTLDTEVTIMAADIVKISLVPDLNTHNSMLTTSDGEDNTTRDEKKLSKVNNKSPPNNQKKVSSKSPMNIKNAFGQFVPAKVEVKMNANTPTLNGNSNNNGSGNGNLKNIPQPRNPSVPLDIGMQPGFGKSNTTASVQTTNKNDKKKTNQQKKNQSTFGTPVDDPVMDEDFDFEKNLALFNKQEIWNKIDANQKPDVVRQTGHVNKKNYRHDENILTSKPAGYRQIKTNYVSAQEYVTDDGIIIPTVTSALRTRIQLQAELCGFSWERQCELLGRNTAEMAIQLLGGARRLSLQNQHQWPKVAIIGDELLNRRHTDIGFATGRQLASQGLKVFIYTKTSVSHASQTHKEAELFKATGNIVTASIDELPSCDLIILSVEKDVDQSVIKWMNDSRSPLMAVDPPASGISNLSIKWSISPVLPLEDISSTCGKVYLSNLTLPDKFFYEAGVNYKSPFGHKFLIPIHLLNQNGNDGNNSNDNE